MMLGEPPARHSKYSPYYQLEGLVDWTLTNPTNVYDGKMCKGYKRGPPTKLIKGNTVDI